MRVLRSRVRRSRMPSYPGPKINLDASDGDWIKRAAWDLPASNVEELRAWLADQGMTVEEFKRLTVYRANFDRLPWLQEL
jgi:hypothetical protein